MQLLSWYLNTVIPERTPFSPSSRSKLDDLIERVTALYTRCVAQGDKAAAEKALSLHQREHVAWERDTVWRTMLTQARGMGADGDEAAVVEGTPRVVSTGEEKGLVNMKTPLGKLKITKKMVSLFVAVVTGVVLLNVPTVEGVEASRCLAVLVFCTIMWATEVRHCFSGSFHVLTNGFSIGYTIVRDLHVCAATPGSSSSHSLERCGSRATVAIRCHQVSLHSLLCVSSNSPGQIYLLSDVLSYDHAPDRRLHDRFSTKQDCDRPPAHHPRSRSGREEAEDGATGVHGCSLLCEHVDQVRN
jgi:hypothetical protein